MVCIVSKQGWKSIWNLLTLQIILHIATLFWKRNNISSERIAHYTKGVVGAILDHYCVCVMFFYLQKHLFVMSLISQSMSASFIYLGPSWAWSYGSWIYNYLWNQCISLLTLWVQILLRLCVLDITVCDKVCLTCDRSVVFSGHPGFVHQ